MAGILDAMTGSAPGPALPGDEMRVVAELLAAEFAALEYGPGAARAVPPGEWQPGQ
jgi:hypothetical protein